MIRNMWRFENTYARLPDALYERVKPATVRAPQVAVLNVALGRDLGLDLGSPDAVDAAQLFSGQVIPAGADPLAQAYAGHQFGHFAMLGDGRALLLGEHRTPSGALVDIAFKGSGPTRFSRRGDGLAALGPMLREYIISEAMHALGIPTTRSLAVITTGTPVMRETLLPGAVLTRVAASHLRVGTMQYAAGWQEGLLYTLADYAIARHYPELLEDPRRHLLFLRAVALRQAHLIAQWQLVGFIHGVMNTDNMSLAGETIDYGPCAFMEAYDPDTVFSSIDEMGRYRYGHQPAIAQWNLARLAEALLPLLGSKRELAVAAAEEVLEEFRAAYQRAWLQGLRAKLGLTTAEPGDEELAQDYLTLLHATKSDYTTSWRALSTGEALPLALAVDPRMDAWLERWEARITREGRTLEQARALMLRTNPAVIARNHRVEEALYAAERRGDYTLLHRLVSVLARPYDLAPEDAHYATPAPASFKNYQTFCGT